MDEKDVIANHRGDERFALCSTFKLVLSAAILARVDGGAERLARRIPVASSDLLSNSPVTTSARAMASTLLRVAAGNALSPDSRRIAVGWLRESTTGLARLRAGLPMQWNAGDKTGTGPDGPANDIAVAWPPGRSPLVIAAYFERTGYAAEDNSAVLAAVGRFVADYARTG